LLDVIEKYVEEVEMSAGGSGWRPGLKTIYEYPQQAKSIKYINRLTVKFLDTIENQFKIYNSSKLLYKPFNTKLKFVEDVYTELYNELNTEDSKHMLKEEEIDIDAINNYLTGLRDTVLKIMILVNEINSLQRIKFPTNTTKSRLSELEKEKAEFIGYIQESPYAKRVCTLFDNTICTESPTIGGTRKRKRRRRARTLRVKKRA